MVTCTRWKMDKSQWCLRFTGSSVSLDHKAKVELMTEFLNGLAIDVDHGKIGLLQRLRQTSFQGEGIAAVLSARFQAVFFEPLGDIVGRFRGAVLADAPTSISASASTCS